MIASMSCHLDITFLDEVTEIQFGLVDIKINNSLLRAL